MAEQAQLGQSPNINLGGYIPAPRESLKQQAIAGLIQSFIGTAMNKLTTPDLGPAMGLPAANWHQVPINPALATQYGLEHPLVAPKAGNIEANTAHTKAETATVAPESAARVGESTARTGLMGAQTLDLNTMRPLDVSYKTAQTEAMKANTDETRAMTPERVANMRSGTVGNIANAENTAAETASGGHAMKALGSAAGAAESAARAGAISEQAAAGKDQTAVVGQKQTIIDRQIGSIMARYDKKTAPKAQSAVREFQKLHGSLPYDGNLEAYLNQLDQYVSKRVQ